MLDRHHMRQLDLGCRQRRAAPWSTKAHYREGQSMRPALHLVCETPGARLHRQRARQVEEQAVPVEARARVGLAPRRDLAVAGDGAQRKLFPKIRQEKSK